MTTFVVRTQPLTHFDKFASAFTATPRMFPTVKIVTWIVLKTRIEKAMLDRLDELADYLSDLYLEEYADLCNKAADEIDHLSRENSEFRRQLHPPHDVEDLVSLAGAVYALGRHKDSDLCKWAAAEIKQLRQRLKERENSDGQT